MKRRYILGYLFGVITAFFICIAYFYFEDYKSMDRVQAYVNGDMVTFSEDSGFYDRSLSVSLVKFEKEK